MVCVQLGSTGSTKCAYSLVLLTGHLWCVYNLVLLVVCIYNVSTISPDTVNTYIYTCHILYYGKLDSTFAIVFIGVRDHCGSY